MGDMNRRVEQRDLLEDAQWVLAVLHPKIFTTASLLADHYVSITGDAHVKPSSTKKRFSRILQDLREKGVVKCFTANLRHRRGPPEKIYCLQETRIPKSHRALPHQLGAIRIAMAVEAACRLPQEPRYTVDVILEYVIQPQTALNDNRPDLVLCVSSERGRALYFVEVDLGTEPLSSSTQHRGDICSKFRRYLYMTNSELPVYNEAFGCTFQGFRVLVVTTRPKGLIKAAVRTQTKDVIGITHMNEVTAQSVFHQPIWVVPGYGTERTSHFNWAPEHAEDF